MHRRRTTQVDAEEMQNAATSTGKEQRPLWQSSATSQALQSAVLPLIVLGICVGMHTHSSAEGAGHSCHGKVARGADMSYEVTPYKAAYLDDTTV